MVRFAKDKLIVEIRCTDMNPADYYEGLQHALYDVFWLATAPNQAASDGANWLANYLGPALAELDPSVKEVLNQMTVTESERPSTDSDHFTDEELTKLIQSMGVGRLSALLRQTGFTPCE